MDRQTAIEEARRLLALEAPPGHFQFLDIVVSRELLEALVKALTEFHPQPWS